MPGSPGGRWTRRELLGIAASLAADSLPAASAAAAVPRQAHPRFRIGACDWSIGMRARPDALGLAARLGLDGVQVSMGSVENDLHLRRPEVQQAYREGERLPARSGAHRFRGSPTGARRHRLYGMDSDRRHHPERSAGVRELPRERTRHAAPVRHVRTMAPGAAPGPVARVIGTRSTSTGTGRHTVLHTGECACANCSRSSSSSSVAFPGLVR